MIAVNDDCPICGCAANRTKIGTTDVYSIRCLRCGDYKITRTASAIVSRGEGTEEERLLLSSWIFENQGIEFSSNHIRHLPKVPKPTIRERSLKLMQEIVLINPTLGEEVEFDFMSRDIGLKETRISHQEFNNLSPSDQKRVKKIFKWFARSWSKNHNEFNFLVVDYLTDELKLFKDWTASDSFVISPAGWEFLEQSYNSVDSPIAFTAMWFNSETDSLWANGIEPAILDAYYQPIRIDQKAFTDRVEDEIMAMIRQSRFLVADYTDHRRAVAYETGFAQGLGIPVIFTCRESDFDDTNFDVSHYPFILWNDDNLELFREKLEKRILGVIGAGPNISQEDL